MVINLVGLEISVPTFIWTIINFFILMFLLNRILYKPMMKFMDARKAKIDTGIKAGEDAKKSLEDNEKRLKEEIAESAGEARAILAAARSEADQEKKEVLAKAHEQVAVMREEVKERIHVEEDEAVDAVKDNMSDLVKTLANKLLNTEEASEEADLIQECVESHS